MHACSVHYKYCIQPAFRLYTTVMQSAFSKGSWFRVGGRPEYYTTLIFVSQCVKLIHLRMISLINVSLPGIVYRVLLSNQNLSPRLNIIVILLIYRHF